MTYIIPEVSAGIIKGLAVVGECIYRRIDSINDTKNVMSNEQEICRVEFAGLSWIN